MTGQQSLSIDVVSDVVCPWCYVGKKRLEAAIALTPDVAVEVRWRPFQLDATMPAGGMDRKQYMMSKFGDEKRIDQAHANLTAMGAAEGIAFDFDAIKVAPNTLDAHRVIRWAASSGLDVQGRLVTELFSRYFERGENIGDPRVLVSAADAAGMDAAVVEAMLATDADRNEVSGEVATASRMGISGVPCFLLESKYAVMGAQEASALADAIRQVATAKASGDI
ncbi:DsbA family oxidoreductase [Oryzicola mucosus]|uniref:DsbA family oxidoreductase n=1 Tax=Oryzicola mucosus TaxID=2767425 RepID=A0A8J6PQR8_9HYPH|nr:DsbA family oxidoreductase [Oryzicola mucosus]MBD0416430.1 DsbA family oxidoreductase [Oryzicola mucosus]